MEIYLALKDQMDEAGSPTSCLGAFSTEDKARSTCQADSDDNATDVREHASPLAWTDDYAETARISGAVRYTVRLVALDEPTYC